MAWAEALKALIPFIGSAIGGALNNTEAARTSTQSGSYTPTLAPEYKTLSDLLRTRAEDRLRSSTDLSGYEGTGLENINDVYRGLNLNASNNLTARGLGTSPVAGIVDQNLNIARGGEMARFLNGLPLIQRQMQNEDFSNATNFLNFGRGSQTTGTAVAPGSVIGGAFSEGMPALVDFLARTNARKASGGKVN